MIERDALVALEIACGCKVTITIHHDEHTPNLYPSLISYFGNTLDDMRISSSGLLVHNHPSGDPTPSRADIQMTETIVEVGKPLGIAVHDHLVIGREGHVSFRATGLI